METRVLTVNQVKLYFATFNNMKGHTEGAEIKMVSFDKQRLVDRIESLVVPMYKDIGDSNFTTDHTFKKFYQKGSKLEWYNLIDTSKPQDHYGHGIGEDWADLDNLESIKRDPGWEFIHE